MSRECKFSRSADARTAGWYSRRHQSRTSSDEARAVNDTLRAKDAPRVNVMLGLVGARQKARAAKKGGKAK